MMTNYLLQSFKERVNQMDWLSDLSKQRSIEKVNEITSLAAFPMEIFDNSYVNGLYSRVSKDVWYSFLWTNITMGFLKDIIKHNV